MKINAGFRTVPMSWEYYEIVQGATIVGLVLGVTLGVLMFINLVRRAREVKFTLLYGRAVGA